MYKFFCSILFSISLLNAANLTPKGVEDLEDSTVVAERPGVYRFTLSGTISGIVLSHLSTIRSNEPCPSKPEDQFRGLLSSFIYPHPDNVSGINMLWSGLNDAIQNLRLILGISDEGLPYFTEEEYKNLPSYQAAIAEFEKHVKNAISNLTLTLDTEVVDQIISHHIEQIHFKTKELLDSYAAFYAGRETPFRKHDIERYLTEMLQLCTTDRITPLNSYILALLRHAGCLELAGSIENDRYVYSPAAMVHQYIAKNGNPTTIILGCGHASELPCLEALGLKQEVWCEGYCQNKPHTHAMVVSLDESSADILCDLNHPDFWAQIRTGTLRLVADETWNPNCYTAETLASIARVLEIGGEFHSNRYYEDCPLKAELLKRGFNVIEANLATQTLKLRKIR